MENESFSSKVKSSLRLIVPRSGCCRKTAEMISNALDYPEDFSKAAECAGKFLCSDCASAYIRVCFIRFGTVTDPAKSYHLEMSFPVQILRDTCIEVLDSHGIAAKRGVRRNRFTLYIKDSEAISDFFAFVGATEAVYYIINLKLMREAFININRQNNFDTANIRKTVEANIVYMDAIKFLIESGNFDSLPDDLRSTARLRIENDTASMSELGRMHSPSISKSGVKHRLDKLLDIANRIKEKK